MILVTVYEVGDAVFETHHGEELARQMDSLARQTMERVLADESPEVQAVLEEHIRLIGTKVFP